MGAAARPEGTVTRGTTGANRLRRLDRWIIHRMGPALAGRPGPLVVDLGFGSSAVTTFELARRLADRVGPGACVLGLDIDADRVAAARRVPVPGDLDVRFLHGGFEVPIPEGRRPLVIRACNVLRQYDEGEVGGAWARMAGRLAPGGLLVEGTCDEWGRLAAWVAVPAPAGTSPAAPESLTLSVDLRTLERPSRVAERLPKALIHRNVPGEAVHELLVALDQAWDRAAAVSVFGPRQRWLAAVRHLAGERVPVLGGPDRWRLGELTVPWELVSPRA